MKTDDAYIGLGSNLDDPRAQVERALDELHVLPSTRLAAISPLYRSRPLGPQDQPDFVNAVARLETALAPERLLTELQQIEARHGRKRGGVRWGPRSLDLDLLIYGRRRIDSGRLTVPHPQLSVRAFVLYPLADVAPAALEIPGFGRLDALLDHVGRDGLIELGENE
ncbi:MAG TPA: 2-amino-4-hydroxy-6-hydroxymethyldihydropteridine diphosphokinase [Gammaproteobacteria bacterium]|nr:2-amino-4-hydroxy-6-hydroxymethyldihydropteridine diphosphokinase [Gammaproteobacteria bacterium]